MPPDEMKLLVAGPDSIRRFAQLHTQAAAALGQMADALDKKDEKAYIAALGELEALGAVQKEGRGAGEGAVA